MKSYWGTSCAHLFTWLLLHYNNGVHLLWQRLYSFQSLLLYVHSLALCGRSLLIPALDRLPVFSPLPLLSHFYVVLFHDDLSKTQKWTCSSPGWIPPVTPAAYRIKCGLFNGTQNDFQVELLFFLPHFPLKNLLSFQLVHVLERSPGSLLILQDSAWGLFPSLNPISLRLGWVSPTCASIIVTYSYTIMISVFYDNVLSLSFFCFLFISVFH